MFSDENDFRENDYFIYLLLFFFVFGCIPKNVLENILQCYAKDRAERAGGEVCVFGK